MDNLENILSELEKQIADVKNINEVNNLKTEYLGKKGKIGSLSSIIKTLPVEEKKEFGKKLNDLKMKATDIINEKENKINEDILNDKLKNESIDITLPATKIPMGVSNILERIVEEIEELLISMGYDVVDGPEIEEDKYNFELLNIPKGHPARDAQDTFYIQDEEILLRSQTSPVQARVCLKMKGKIL